MFLKENIKYLRKQKNISQEAMASFLGYKSFTTIQKWETGVAEPPFGKVYLIAEFLGVSVNELTYENLQERDNAQAFSSYGFEPVKMQRLPHLGKIACGEPIFITEDQAEYIYTDLTGKADFTLQAFGDSMTGAKINDGDIVYIRRQDTVENGEIAAVIIDNEALLKRVYFENETLILTSENPAYMPKTFSGEALSNVRIIGKAVSCQFKIK